MLLLLNYAELACISSKRNGIGRFLCEIFGYVLTHCLVSSFDHSCRVSTRYIRAYRFSVSMLPFLCFCLRALCSF